MSRRILWTRVALLGGVVAITGTVAALAWALLVRLPGYVVQDDLTAVMDERGHTAIIGADAWFTVIGVGAGLLLGVLVWSWFRHAGWPAALIAVLAGLAAGLVCWRVGTAFGPGPFAERLATARPGDTVPVSLELRAGSAVLAWALTALAPTLFLSALGPDLDESAPELAPLPWERPAADRALAAGAE